MRLSYSDPLVAVLLRRLAWEYYVAKKSISVKDAVTGYVQLARAELGLRSYQPRSESGGADAFIQELRHKNLLAPNHNARLVPHEQDWAGEWRLLYLPPHDLVRQLSAEPVVDQTSASIAAYTHFTLTLRHPTVPRLDIYVGEGKAGGSFPSHRGLYFLGRSDGLYIGSTSEFGVRSRQHADLTESVWYAFMAPASTVNLSGVNVPRSDEGNNSVTLDALLAAEGMLISFWNEVCEVLNDKRGSDRKPDPIFLQQAVSLVMGVSAGLVWLLREGKAHGLSIQIDAHFKSSRREGWPECYFEIPSRVSGQH